MRDDKKEAVKILVSGGLTLVTNSGEHSGSGESGEVCVRGPLAMTDYLSETVSRPKRPASVCVMRTTP